MKKKKGFKHLTLEERTDIGLLKAEGKKLEEIAEQLGRSKSTISRELRRNQPPNNAVRYNPIQSHKRATTRKEESHFKVRLNCDIKRNYVEEHLKLNWSPETISGRFKLEYPNLSINHESIYQYIYNDRPDLATNLVSSRSKRRKRNPNSKKHSSRIPNRVSIKERSKDVDNREEFGHWETDTAVSRESKAVLQPIVERKSRYMILSILDGKTAKEMASTLIQKLKDFPSTMLKTITYDNGTENAQHERTNKELDIKSFFCEPYSSWEKGTVEHFIGLVRRYLPKKTDFAKITLRELKRIESLINNRPLKCLGYMTPHEVFHEGLACCN